MRRSTGSTSTRQATGAASRYLYEGGQLDQARDLLAHLAESRADAGPGQLKEIGYQPPGSGRPVIRRRDVLDLFDTTSDLAGNDIDISRYVRDGRDTDVQVYWREFDEPDPHADLSQPGRAELCRVSIAGARGFLADLEKRRRRLGSGSERDRLRAGHMRAWHWNPLEKQWETMVRAYPGQMVLLHADAGGYDARLGWTGETGRTPIVPLIDAAGELPAESDGYGSDPDSVLRRWVPLSDHLGHVRDEAVGLAGDLGLTEFAKPLATAALWHDTGKAHPAFQHKLLAPLEERPELLPPGQGPWAKSGHRLRSSDVRRHFRHELASALAWLGAGSAVDSELRDLVAYLVAAHHGKVRMSIRSLPGETAPTEPGRLVRPRHLGRGRAPAAFICPTAAVSMT